MGLSAPVDFTGAIARTRADTNTSALKVEIRFIFCLLIRMNQILCLAMLLRGVVSQDLIGFLPLVKAKQTNKRLPISSAPCRPSVTTPERGWLQLAPPSDGTDWIAQPCCLCPLPR